jgi:hypothetical protein
MFHLQNYVTQSLKIWSELRGVPHAFKSTLTFNVGESRQTTESSTVALIIPETGLTPRHPSSCTGLAHVTELPYGARSKFSLSARNAVGDPASSPQANKSTQLAISRPSLPLNFNSRPQPPWISFCSFEEARLNNWERSTVLFCSSSLG